MINRYFGTDGIRARFGEWPLSPHGLSVIANGIRKYLHAKKISSVAIGCDTRSSCKEIELRICSELEKCPIDVKILGVISTPMMSFCAMTGGAELGIMISASHNPYEYNGIKMFDRFGNKFSLGDEAELEEFFDEVAAGDCGRSRVSYRAEKGSTYHMQDDFVLRYKNFLLGNMAHALEGLSIVVDCANGSYSNIARDVMKSLGAKSCVSIADAPSGLNINYECGATRPLLAQRTVLETRSDMGMCFDGDGDRVIFIDERGRVIGGDQIIAYIAKKVGLEGTAGVVGTEMSNKGLEFFVTGLSMGFSRTLVGDRFVSEELSKRGWKIGGEPSGHVILKEFLPTGDGLLVGAYVAGLVASCRGVASEVLNVFFPFAQVLFNMPIEKVNPFAVEDAKSRGAFLNLLGCDGRISIRKSGTEPVLRIMVEAETHEHANETARAIAKFISA
ncbi:hypothetical protein [Candidatus Hydrogenosomobacter endosymbioticus]|uniref:Phosphoglucosamine mutase n=1 Tax=Candidatus Hydrogenosomobacter endosymbioticus TaxID=2558174 RepID=A0ABN6L3P4_9PROT|nr:hypothetical protein [Candidatus Hydrogenosomobacter endosymbioticus]BDB96539.1 phosphoglucosamine mutase [Candidatus Hydrogenosomobacter endosymbioticus]